MKACDEVAVQGVEHGLAGGRTRCVGLNIALASRKELRRAFLRSTGGEVEQREWVRRITEEKLEHFNYPYCAFI